MTRDEMIAEFTKMLDEQYDDGYILGLQHGLRIADGLH